MIAVPTKKGVSVSSLKTRNYRIHLKIAPGDREDAWELCRVVSHYGGVEVSDGCFAFTSEERWLMASESLRVQFGPEYFVALDAARST